MSQGAGSRLERKRPRARAAIPPRERRQPKVEHRDEGVVPLQRSAGNSAVVEMIRRSAGPQVPVAPPGHSAEVAASREADRVGSAKPRGEPAPAPKTIPESSLKATGPGTQLAAPVRAEMQRALGPEKDLGSVRIHTGEASARLAEGIGARAFTYGRDIHFGRGEFRPDHGEGRHILAHELAHATGTSAPGSVHRFPATALAGPTEWRGHTRGVKRPGEGASGGIYILEGDKDDPVKRVVVKPIFGKRGDGQEETSDQLVFADRAMSELFGIKAPLSRSVRMGSAEFTELMELCLPKAPQGPQKTGDEGMDLKLAESFVHLSKATGFVVMSEVTEATSIGSLATKAGGDRKASRALYDTLFSHNFLAQLGRITVADMLLGHNDRLLGGEQGVRRVNLGNIMVSTANDESSVYAIDTTAVLGTFDPEQIVREGTASSSLSGGWFSTKDELTESTKGPGGIMDDFFSTIIARVRSNTRTLGRHRGGAQAGPADLLEQTYQRQRSSVVASFETGWQDALTRIFQLVHTQEGRHRMRDLAGGFEGSEGGGLLRKTALKTNAMYLAGIAAGKNHQESSADPAVYALRRWVQEFNVVDLVFPADGYHSMLAKVPKDALSADLPDGLASLPRPGKLHQVRSASRNDRRFSDYNRDRFQELAEAVTKAKAEAAEFGSKTKGSKDVQTNRARAGLFLAESYGLEMGAARAVAISGQSLLFFDRLKSVAGMKLSSNQAATLLSKLDFAESNIGPTRAQLAQYARSLAAAAEGVGQMRKYRQRKDLVEVLESASKFVTEATERYDLMTQQVNPNLIRNLLKAMVVAKKEVA